ncbi:MAG: hypothetical protein U5K43_10135 [Halofilum sp. (in: g-proteobacteria)]|nr:hypothetical protein [Halofilum sp. (in: g-proteobacteria)]
MPGVRNEYLLRPTEVELGEVTYPAHRASCRPSCATASHADVLDQLERWHELLALFPGDAPPAFRLPDELPGSIEDDDDLEAAAEAIRRAWRLGDDPIPGQIGTLESNGILVVQTNAEGGGRFNDGSPAMAGEDLARPVIVVHSGWPGHRPALHAGPRAGPPGARRPPLRAARCREGVQSLCGRPSRPRRGGTPGAQGRIRPDAGAQGAAAARVPTTASSVQGRLFRALHAGIIASTTHQELFRAFTRHGWRTREPGPDGSTGADGPICAARLSRARGGFHRRVQGGRAAGDAREADSTASDGTGWKARTPILVGDANIFIDLEEGGLICRGIRPARAHRGAAPALRRRARGRPRRSDRTRAWTRRARRGRDAGPHGQWPRAIRTSPATTPRRSPWHASTGAPWLPAMRACVQPRKARV